MLDHIKRFWKEEDGMGVVEIALIIIVIVGVVILFRGKVEKLIEDIFNKINNEYESV